MNFVIGRTINVYQCAAVWNGCSSVKRA